MKAISLYQPWATLIAIGEKRIETRSWSTKYRGPLAIHASTETKYIGMRSKYYICDKEPFYSILMGMDLDELPLPRGAIIATCELEACYRLYEGLLISDQEKAFGDYTPGRFVWMLDRVRKLDEPIIAKGHQGLWEWTPPDKQIS